MTDNEFWEFFNNNKVKSIVDTNDFHNSRANVHAESFFVWGNRTDQAIIKLHLENEVLKNKVKELEDKLKVVMAHYDGNK